MRNTVLVLVALVIGMLAVSGPGTTDPNPTESAYGFGVRVLPDEEYDDFLQCGLSVFALADGGEQWELPSLRIVVGGANSMKFRGVDGIDITLNCAVNAEKTEVTYEVEGQRNGRVVSNHLGTIRFQ